MFFSVIVPVYKIEQYLPACIESVLNQTFSDFELILVDDGSPDNCPVICDEYARSDNRIKVIHKENGGLVSARRAGIKLAAGDYVFNLDGDDRIEKDALECAYKIIKDTACEMVSFALRWVKNGHTLKITDDGIDEGLYTKKDIEKHIFPRLLMDKNMEHLSYSLAGKAIQREFLTPHQLGVSEKISVGEDLCCVLPCYLHVKSVYISKKPVYLYTIREESLTGGFNEKQVYLVEDAINEMSKNDTGKVLDFEAQLCRYSCFTSFAILGLAAAGNHSKSVKAIKESIMNSLQGEKIPHAEFEHISLKSRITIFLMKKNYYKAAFYFLRLCELIKARFGKTA